MATLTVPLVPPSPSNDAIQLHKAFKGSGCDSATVISILVHRDATQRAFIRQEYQTLYSEVILKRLTSELSDKLETAVLLWMHDPTRRDAEILWQALSQNGIDLRTATEIICSRTPSQLQILNQLYVSKFGTYPEHVIQRQATGDHKKVESLRLLVQ